MQDGKGHYGKKTNEQLLLEINQLHESLNKLEKCEIEHTRVENLISKLSSLKEKLILAGSLTGKLKLITDGVVDIFDGDLARIWMVKEGDLCKKGCIHADVTEGPCVCRDRNLCLHLMASSGRYTNIDDDYQRIPLGCRNIGRVATGEYPQFITNDLTHHPQFDDQQWVRKIGLVSLAGLRLFSPEGKSIGVLALFSKHIIETEEEKLLEDLANFTSHIIISDEAEKAIIESEVKYRALFENSGTAMLFIDEDMTISLVNKESEKLSGYRKDEVEGKVKWTEMVANKDDLNRMMEYHRLRRIDPDAAPSNYEFQFVDKKGMIKDVIATVSMIPGTKKSLAAILDITELKKATKALRDSEMKLRAILESSPDSITVTDLKMNILECNKATVLMYHASSKDELIGLNASQLVNPQDLLKLTRIIEKTIKEKENVTFELELFKKDGTVFPAELSANVILDSSDAPVAFLSITKDITERKLAEKLLKESAENFQAIAENASEGILIAIGDRGTHVYANQMAAEITGYTTEELLKTNIADLVPYDELNEIMDIYKTRITGETFPSRHETCIERKNGEVIPIEVTGARTVWKGEPADMALIYDITQRKKAETELKSSKERLKILFDDAPDVYFLSDIKGNIIDCNNATEELTHYKKEEIIGKNFKQLKIVPSSQISKLADKTAKIALGKAPETIEIVLKRKDGKKLMVEIHAHLISMYGQKFYLGTIRDITKRKRIEDIMQARSRLLEFAASHSMDELLKITLDKIEALTGSTVGFYHLIEPDQKTLSLQNWSTNTLKNMCTTEGRGFHYDIAQAGVWADCIHQLRPVIHNDYESLPHRKSLPEGHPPVIRELVVPIIRGNIIKAIIGVGNKPTNYDDNDIEITSQLGDLSWDIVERKKAEKELEKNQNELKAIIDGSPIPQFVIDQNHHVIHWNQALEVYSGIKAQDIVGTKQHWKAFYDNKRPCLADLLIESTPEEIEEWYPGKFNLSKLIEGAFEATDFYPEILGGTWLYFTAAPIRDAEGNIIGAVETLNDVTQRKQAEKELERANSYNRGLIEVSMDPLVTIGSDGKITDVNVATEKVTGYLRDELIGSDFSDYFTQPDKAREGYQQVFKEGFVRDYPLDIRHKEGHITPVLYNASVYRDDSGEVVGVFAAARDITQLKEAEDELKSSEERLKILFDYAPDSLFLLDLKGYLVDCNRAVKEILGYRREELIGKNFSEVDNILPLKEIPKLAAKMAKIALGHYPLKPIELDFTRKDNEKITMELTAYLVNISGKRLLFAIGRDITERKQMEDQIKKSLEEKEMLLREIHHRVKNNLMIISSLLNLQSRYIKDKEALGIFKESQSRARSMAIIHERLYQSTDLKRIDFGDYIQTLAMEIFRSYRGDTGIKLNMDVESLELDINTLVPLGLIVNELVSNCMKYAFGEGEKGEINIGFCKLDGEYELRVFDTGVGFPEDMDFRKTKTLGLQLVNNLVRQIDGTIELDRSHGTGFTIKFKEIEM